MTVNAHVLIVSTEELGQRLYLVTDGRRRELLGRDRVLHFGGIEPVKLSADDFFAYPLGAPISEETASFSTGDRLPATSIEWQQMLTAGLRGEGIEIGAGNLPFPLPLDCRVSYVDRISAEQFGVAYAGYKDKSMLRMDAVMVDYVTDLEKLDAIDDDSLNFVIASHVIEHCRNPIKAMEQMFCKLSSGGRLILVVPDMNRTFDKERSLTSMDHLMEDYVDPSLERNRQHYFEVVTLSFPQPSINPQRRVELMMKSDMDCHFHTFTFESFGTFVRLMREKFAPFSDLWSREAYDLPWKPAEFYYVLTK